MVPVSVPAVGSTPSRTQIEKKGNSKRPVVDAKDDDVNCSTTSAKKQRHKLVLSGAIANVVLGVGSVFPNLPKVSNT
jgi:hypothetical protein